MATAARQQTSLQDRERASAPAWGSGCWRQHSPPIMTAYRQQALACAAALSQDPGRPRDLKNTSPDAPKILRRNVYGWFDRLERGVYTLTESGKAALLHEARVYDVVDLRRFSPITIPPHHAARIAPIALAG
jgi:hypothetical protein